jgi:c-di-GMP-binding flagellar brake protein YcgR
MMSSTPKRAPNPLDRRRRRHVRYRADFRVSVNHLQGDHYQEVEGHCRDLSEAGIGILLATELNLGEVASLGMTLPGTTTAWGPRAVVRHRRGYQYGFEFLALTPEQREALTRYLQILEREDGLD